ncbi:uncharacterized protein RBU57_002227 [Macrochelys suwanniensis]
MQDRGYNRDAQQCRVKIKELRQAYQRTRDANGRSGSKPQTCRFYDELHAILGGAASTNPPMFYDSVSGSSETTEEHFQEEEDDDNDAENGAQTQQGSGEAPFPDSQELFVTLEPVPYEPTQGVLLDLEGGEGTSAVNVSTLPLSSPSQRLAKIRSKKKRNRDDMFSELMQSSHTETAQQNAWRQTLSESRKAQFDREDRWRAEGNEQREEESRWRLHAERRQDCAPASAVREDGSRTSLLRAVSCREDIARGSSVTRRVAQKAANLLADIYLLRVARETRAQLLNACGFHPGLYAAQLCAALVPAPLIAKWHGTVSYNGGTNKAAVPWNLHQMINKYLLETFQSLSLEDSLQVSMSIDSLLGHAD